LNLVFVCPSAKDNRPLNFKEFEKKTGQVVYTTATPGKYELEHSGEIAEQIIRPTGLIDPEIIIKPIQALEKEKGQVQDLSKKLRRRLRMAGEF